MYLDVTKKDPNRNRRNGLIVFVLCIIWIACVVKCAGQVSRTHPFKEAKNITRLSPKQSMVFYVNAENGIDTIFLGLFADSLTKKTYTFHAFVHYPKGIDISKTSISFGFSDGSIEILHSDRVESKFGYVEYTIDINQFYNLRDKKCENIDFIVDDYNIPFPVRNNYISNFFLCLK